MSGSVSFHRAKNHCRPRGIWELHPARRLSEANARQRADRFAHFICVLVAQLAIFLQRAVYGLFELGRNVRIQAYRLI